MELPELIPILRLGGLSGLSLSIAYKNDEISPYAVISHKCVERPPIHANNLVFGYDNNIIFGNAGHGNLYLFGQQIVYKFRIKPHDKDCLKEIIRLRPKSYHLNYVYGPGSFNEGLVYATMNVGSTIHGSPVEQWFLANGST